MSRTIVITAALLATGAAALIYQVTWQRYLSVIVGTDHVSTATTLAVFLTGLSLGYALCGSLTTRVRRHFLTYGLLELAIGSWGLAFPFVFAAVRAWTVEWSFAQPYLLVGQSLAVASLLILPPTVLMGATVPFLTRALAATRETLTGTHAWVYGVNTAGAVAGVLIGAFHLLPHYGLRGSLRAAAVLNLLAAAPFLVLALRRQERSPLTVVAPSDTLTVARYSFLDLRLLALLSGFAVMSQETALIRLGSQVLGGSSLVLAMIVAVFVASVATGSLYVSRLRAIQPPLLWRTTALAAAWWMLVYLTVDLWPYYAHLLRIGVHGTSVGFYLFHGMIFVAFLALLGPAVALMGCVLPLVFHEFRSSLEGAGRSSGHVLAWNAAGALLGSLTGGLLLFYVVDLGRVLIVGPLVGVAMAMLTMRHVGSRARLATLALAVIGIALLVFQPLHDSSRLAVGTFRIRAPVRGSFEGPKRFYEERYRLKKLLSQTDGPLASVAVMESPSIGLPNLSPLELFVNGKSESNTRADWVTLRASAHLPALLSNKRERVLIVGLGTGVTAGEFLLYPEVRRIEVAEISSAVADALPLFATRTRRVHEDPRFRLRLEDARLLLRRPGESWDVIVAEPSNPWISGVDLLFTEEFFRDVESRLAPGGLLLQWVHYYEANLEMVHIICNTLHRVFPHLRAYHGTYGDLLIVATRTAIAEPDLQRAELLWDSLPEVQDSLREVGIESLDDLLGRELGTFSHILERAAAARTHRAGSTRLSHLAGRAMFDGTSVNVPELLPHPDAGRSVQE